MARLVLHIGLEKTGTKALQGFLTRNRAALRLMGVRYPRCEGPDGRKWSYQRDLGVTLRAEATGASTTQWGPAAEVIAAYAEKAAEARLTVLSNEMLAAPLPQIAQRLRPLAQQFDVAVVVYLRRQDEWALSAYRQAVLEAGRGEARRVQDWLDDPATRARLDYDWILRGWEEAFGQDAMRVRLYPHHLPLVSDFIQVAGLPSAAAVLPERGRRVNESVADEVVIEALARNGGTAERPTLSQSARDRLLSSVADGNERVRARYFPRRKSLFGLG